jgi:nicotinic acid mononucleotide adenylyltransferase
MDPEGIRRLIDELDPAGPPRLGFVRRAPRPVGPAGGTLLCLSASFNPITQAHLRLLAEAGALVPPDEILLLLSLANVDKGVSGLPVARRVRLLLTVAEGRPGLSVALASHGRFVDKAAAVRTAYPPGTRVHFLVGFDTLVRLFDPRYYTDCRAALATLFAQSHFVAANRAPAAAEELRAFLARPDVAPYRARIRSILLPAEVAALSATDVRRRLAQGESVAGLVPPETLDLLEAWRTDTSEA